MKIAVIPARGGSKRIPRKNIKDFIGKPIIAWSIEAAKDAGIFDHIIVSTDDHEIAEVAEEWGAQVPFIRPSQFADDHASTQVVINHCIEEVSKIYGMPDYVCCILATAPFLKPIYIVEGFDKLVATGVEFVFSITGFPYPVQRAVRINQLKQLEMIYPQYLQTRSQDMEEAYHDAGQFYWGRSEAFLTNAAMLTSAAGGVLLPQYLVQDIDTPEDWKRAELMFKALTV